MNNEQRAAHVPPYICRFICGSEIGTYCYLLIYQVSLFLSPIDSVDGPHLRVRVWWNLCLNAAKLHTTKSIPISIAFSFGIYFTACCCFFFPFPSMHMGFSSSSSLHCILWWWKWFLFINAIEHTIYGPRALVRAKHESSSRIRRTGVEHTYTRNVNARVCSTVCICGRAIWVNPIYYLNETKYIQIAAYEEIHINVYVVRCTQHRDRKKEKTVNFIYYGYNYTERMEN